MNQLYEDDYIEELYLNMMKQVDLLFIAEIKQKELEATALKERNLANNEITLEPAIFSFCRKTGQWLKNNGEKVEKVHPLIGLDLTKIVKSPITEEEFHRATEDQYDKFLNDYKNRSYFYYQTGQWFYIDQEEYAHPINDERLLALKNLRQ